MNSILLFATLLITTISMAAQPTISYIIPDIGTPDMNTYVEVIAPNTAQGSFGTDGMYLNSPTDKVRLECVNPADTNKIVIGPIVVSWNGRLLSTQIFVRKYMLDPSRNLIPPPTEENWNLLKREYRIPIRVFVSGQYSNVDTFYIVKPYSFGNKSTSSERVLGTETLGIRSRRGAMLVDSMILGSGTYTVSTVDCDPNTVGNQGYLPISILTKGNIVGDNSGTIISVNASGRDGGAGGGGGGGKFCDKTILGGGDGDNGGSGYVGGGKGGRNSSSSSHKQNGESTGPIINGTNGSLNGMPGGSTPSTNYEASGGGGGHPFGTSGVGCNGGPTCDLDGGYGGGTGYKDNQPGGAGGFYKAGANSIAGSKTGGKIVGNDCLVPLSGGSGGASGNPRFFTGGCGGEGGGGGGGISLYGYSISNIQCTAIGADGGNDDNANSDGGSGSGGAVVLMSKSNLTNSAGVNVSGGSKTPAGGAGRFRHDAMDMQPPIDINFGGSIYRGPTTDSTTIIPRLKGAITVSSNGKPFWIFIKPEGKPWFIGDKITAPAGPYSQVIDFSDVVSFPETRYYFVIMQLIPAPDVSQYTSEPTLVMSQAGANILQIADQPIINSSRDRTLNTIYCSNDVFYDTVSVRNDGVVDLVVSGAAFVSGNQGFSLVSPLPSEFPLTIQKPTPKNFIVRYSSPPITGTFFTDTLKIVNNDPDAGKSPWSISYTGNRDTVVIALLEGFQDIPAPDTINFGKVCLASGSAGKTIRLQNKSTYPISADNINLSDQSNFTAALILNGPIPSNSTRAINLAFKARTRGSVETKLNIPIDKCGYSRTILLMAEGIETDLAFTGTGQFSTVKVGTSSRVTFTLTNNGNTPASLQDFSPLPAPFRIVSTVPVLPAIIPPGEVVRIVCEYTPTKLGDDSATLTAISLLQNVSCPDTERIALAGKGVQSQVVLSSNSIDMGTVARCDTKTDSVRLTNVGTGALTISKRAVITGKNFAAFSIISQPTPPFTLATNQNVVFVVRFTPSLGVSGVVNTAILSIETDDPQNPIINIPISATKQTIQVVFPRYIDLGVAPVSSSVDSSITLTNSGALDANLIRILSTRQDITVTPSSISLAALGGSSQFLITSSVPSVGIIKDTLRFIFNKPCEDTIICVIDITGISADLAITNKISFGDVVSCQQKTDSVSYTNTGQADLQLMSMGITGADATVFSFSSPMNFPVKLTPAQTIKREVIFNPILTTDGVKNAQVVTTALINGESVNYNTDLVGERRSVLLAAPGEVTFGGIEISSTSTQFHTIRNNGVDTIEILQPRLRVNSGEISLIFDPSIFPLTLKPKEDVTISVRFAPTTETNQTDTIVFPLSKPCQDERLVIVTGTGLPIVRTIISLPVDTAVNPAAIGYKIPIRVSLSPASRSLPQVSFTAEFEFDKHIFLPLSVNRGTMTTQIDAATGKRIVRVNVDTLDITSGRPTLVEIYGNALLGSVQSDSLRWRKFQWGRTSAIVDGLTNGFLQLTICEKGGDRLISDSLLGFGITARPQPVSDNLILSVATVELGQHSVQVVNTSGQQVFRTHWEMTETNRSGIWEDIVMDTGTLPSGMYLAILRTPTKVKTTQIMIVR